MPDYLEVWQRTGVELAAIDESQEVTIGASPGNSVVIVGDPKVSRLHAVLQRFPAGWCIRDLGSRNGTFVNGERIWSDRVLHSGDDLKVGTTRLVLRPVSKIDDPARTEGLEAPPPLTPRERDVLIALCRPMASGAVFTEPATIHQVATELVVSDAAVKQHLLNLYDKFAIHGDGERRRVRLANEAIMRGAVAVADLKEGGSGSPALEP
jgi:hypothetical protein